MHPGQLEVTAETAAALVGEQFPQWRGLAIRPVRTHGTVNLLSRLGDDLVLRFPLAVRGDRYGDMSSIES